MIDDGLHDASANIRFFLESFPRLKPGGVYVIEDITPNDADLMGSFARCMASVSKSIVYQLLDHPLNKVDNRLFLLQKA
jgi:predicted methyltransferase